ncbi:MAG TPA: hypothetical protein VMP67_09385 [Candidatus Limnocylindria bacterium]|nr:hypothetical protein [Candidatus Limnocylindria bacterium]
MLSQTIARYGLPLALYTDRHGIFQRDPRRPPTLAEQLTGKRSMTQVGRALDELGVEWIPANSAPAKGRIERGWGTLQDRLVSDLRRAGAATRHEANVVLARHLPRHNARFAMSPADAQPAWRSWPLEIPPEEVLCLCYLRKAERDATLAWNGTALAIPRRRDGRSWPTGSSSSRSTSTAACGCATRVSATGSPRHRRARHCCARDRCAAGSSYRPRQDRGHLCPDRRRRGRRDLGSRRRITRGVDNQPD